MGYDLPLQPGWKPLYTTHGFLATHPPLAGNYSFSSYMGSNSSSKGPTPKPNFLDYKKTASKTESRINPAKPTANAYSALSLYSPN